MYNFKYYTYFVNYVYIYNKSIQLLQKTNNYDSSCESLFYLSGLEIWKIYSDVIGIRIRGNNEFTIHINITSDYLSDYSIKMKRNRSIFIDCEMILYKTYSDSTPNELISLFHILSHNFEKKMTAEMNTFIHSLCVKK